MRRWLAMWAGMALLWGSAAYGQSAVQAGPAYTPGGAPGSIPLSSLATQPPGTIVGVPGTAGSTQSPSALSSPFSLGTSVYPNPNTYTGVMAGDSVDHGFSE